jgi:hypothetical protein
MPSGGSSEKWKSVRCRFLHQFMIYKVFELILDLKSLYRLWNETYQTCEFNLSNLFFKAKHNSYVHSEQSTSVSEWLFFSEWVILYACTCSAKAKWRVEGSMTKSRFSCRLQPRLSKPFIEIYYLCTLGLGILIIYRETASDYTTYSHSTFRHIICIFFLGGGADKIELHFFLQSA